MNEDLTFIVKHPFEFALILLLVFIGIHFRNLNNLDDVTKAYAEITAVSGGFTSYQYNSLIEDLEKIGYDKEQTKITIKATEQDGTDISNKVTNVTPINQSPYPLNPVYAPRGSKIVLTVNSSRKSILNSIYKWLGVESSISKGKSRRIYMSERVE